MFGNGAAIGMDIIVPPLRPIRQDHPAAPAASTVEVVGDTARGAAVYLTAATARLTTVAAALASVFVSSSSSERHDILLSGGPERKRCAALRPHRPSGPQITCKSPSISMKKIQPHAVERARLPRTLF